MVDKTKFVYASIIITVAILFVGVIATSPVWITAETESECIRYQSDFMIKIRNIAIGDGFTCNWLVEQLQKNGSGYMMTGYSFADGFLSCNCEIFIFTKGVSGSS